MVAVDTGDVLSMRDSSVADLIDDLNRKQASSPWGQSLAGALIALSVLAMFGPGQIGTSLAAGITGLAWILVLPAWLVGYLIDQTRRRTVLYYDLKDAAADRFEQMTKQFDVMGGCRKIWDKDFFFLPDILLVLEKGQVWRGELWRSQDFRRPGPVH